MNPQPESGTALRFLLTEVRCGLTFASIARASKPHETERIERNIRNAQKAFNTALRFRDRFTLDDLAAAELNYQLEELKVAIQAILESRKGHSHASAGEQEQS